MRLQDLTALELDWIARPVDKTVTGNVHIVAKAGDTYSVHCGGKITEADCFQRAVRIAICYSDTDYGRTGKNATIKQNGKERNTFFSGSYSPR